jgi:predicted dinucleotide-binding enzyme
MKIGILGSGGVAQTLGAGLIKHGHGVMLGSREPDKLAGWTAGVPGARAGSPAEAAAFGELLILAVKGRAALVVLQAAGAAALDGKTVIDACNPMADAPPVDGVLQYTTGPNESLMEALQQAFPQAHFVKAFNSVGSAHMVDPQFAGGPPTMFIAGNDDAAKAQVSALLREVGWEAADMGTAVGARAIEPLAMLWCIPGLRHNQWSHAFKLLQAA